VRRVDTFKILGVRVDCVDKQTLLERVDEWSRQARKRTIAYLNAHCLNTAYQDSALRDCLNGTDLNYADGISLVWASRWLGGPRLSKLTGREWIGDFLTIAERTGLRFYILAGEPGIAQKAKENILKHYPNIQIAGTCDGFFREKSQSSAMQEMNDTQSQVVFVGLGVGVQEKWITEQRNQIAAPVCWSVGALFDYVAGAEKEVPRWIDRLALEWLWRLIQDPAHKWRRYLIGNPLFVIRVLKQKYSAKE